MSYYDIDAILTDAEVRMGLSCRQWWMEDIGPDDYYDC